MLSENQQIIYRRNGEEICRLTAELYKKLWLNIAQYVRWYQPFTEKGDSLTIPKQFKESGLERVWTTTEVQEIKKEGNKLVCRTKNSVYEIEYANIDLERILQDGMFKGVNSGGGVNPTLFP